MWKIEKRIRRILRLPTRNRCCRKLENLGPPERYGRAELNISFRRCQRCGARHFEVVADPGRLGIKGGRM